ncbi:MAG: DUF58 domain-containing protein [Victivallales bacterium]|nr:DUF58 domain-containing protein [Victivallales bacterium]
MPEHDGIGQLLSAQDLTRLGRLALTSRFTVEGTMTGSHKSQRKGISVEFADYRQYVPGDDPKHLDWKVYGRNERLYLREYEEETTLRVHLLVDASASMAYAGKDISKYTYACRCAAALAYITIHHQDNVGLALFDETTRALLPAKSGPEHLRVICNTLASHTPSEHTDMSKTLHNLAENAKRRGLIVIFSDLFDDMEKIKSALAHFRRRRHDVIVYQILDRSEVDFPFRNVSTFEDLETGERIITSPRDIKNAYQKAIEEFLQQSRQICSSLNVEHVLALTDVPPVDMILRHLRQRALAGR